MKKEPKSKPRSRKKGSDSLLRLVRAELRLEKTSHAHDLGAIAERDRELAQEKAARQEDVQRLTERIDDLSANFDDAEGRASALYQRLRLEEARGREQRLNISVLLQQIMALNGLVAEQRDQLRQRQAQS